MAKRGHAGESPDHEAGRIRDVDHASESSTLRGLRTTGTKELDFTAVPASHPVTNKPATPASLMLSARITSCFSIPNMATWTSVSISYRESARFNCAFVLLGKIHREYHFLTPVRLARLSLPCYKSRTNCPCQPFLRDGTLCPRIDAFDDGRIQPGASTGTAGIIVSI